jgi:hypothetical protein
MKLTEAAYIMVVLSGFYPDMGNLWFRHPYGWTVFLCTVTQKRKPCSRQPYCYTLFRMSTENMQTKLVESSLTKLSLRGNMSQVFIDA